MQAESTSTNFGQAIKFLGTLLGVCGGVIVLNWVLGLVMPMGAALAIQLFLLAVFLILLVLVQRGRGGGLAGALGGAGGSSAFGAKAGDNFTWFTIYTATAWIVLCVVAAFWARNRGDALDDGLQPRAPISSTADVDSEAGAADETAPGETAPGKTATDDEASMQDTPVDASAAEASADDAPADDKPSEG